MLFYDSASKFSAQRMSHGDRSVNALAVLEKSAAKSPGGLMKSPSFALSDLDAYRRAFNAYDHLKNGTVVASDIIHVANRLGYRISNSQMAVSGLDV